MTLINPHTKIKIKVESAPKRIDFYGRIFELEVTPTQMPSSPFRATYWQGAQDMFNWWGTDPEEAASDLWKTVKATYPSTMAVPEPHDVELNKRTYTLPSKTEAVAFAALWNGTPLFQILNP
jgi:hypothetical protein